MRCAAVLHVSSRESTAVRVIQSSQLLFMLASVGVDRFIF